MNWRDVKRAAHRAEMECAVQAWLICLLTLATVLSALLY